jgi:hypothetical protein
VGAAVGARQPKYLPEHCELVAAFYLEAKHDGVRRDNVYIADALSEAWGESVTRKVAEQLVEGPAGAGTAPRDVWARFSSRHPAHRHGSRAAACGSAGRYGKGYRGSAWGASSPPTPQGRVAPPGGHHRPQRARHRVRDRPGRAQRVRSSSPSVAHIRRVRCARARTPRRAPPVTADQNGSRVGAPAGPSVVWSLPHASPGDFWPAIEEESRLRSCAGQA